MRRGLRPPTALASLRSAIWGGGGVAPGVAPGGAPGGASPYDALAVRERRERRVALGSVPLCNIRMTYTNYFRLNTIVSI